MGITHHAIYKVWEFYEPPKRLELGPHPVLNYLIVRKITGLNVSSFLTMMGFPS